MKKLTYLFLALLIVACSDDEGNPCVYNPTLTTSAVTNVTETSATLNGVISIVSENCDNSTNTEQGFVYSTEVQPTIEDTQVNVNGTEVTTTLESLEPNTTYYIRTFLTNDLGEFYGNEVSFMTSEEQVCVYNLNTQDITEIITTSAVLNGTIITEDIENCELPNTEQGFVYSTEVQPTIEDTQVNVNGTEVTTTLENLEPNTTYYVRTFLTNALGEFYGNEVSFMSGVTESEFKGLWSGGFAGDDNGTWTLTVKNTGTVVGSFTSKDLNEVYSLSGSVDENGEIQASLTLENAIGSFEGNLNNGLASGFYTVNVRNGDFQGRISTSEEENLVNYWNYYSAEYETGEILYYDNELIYCPGLYMEFREDGTFTDYYYAEFGDSSPNCPQEEMYGTFSVQEGYYEFLYILGGSQGLNDADVYITFPDDNTMTYNYGNVLWTYKKIID